MTQVITIDSTTVKVDGKTYKLVDYPLDYAIYAHRGDSYHGSAIGGKYLRYSYDASSLEDAIRKLADESNVTRKDIALELVNMDWDSPLFYVRQLKDRDNRWGCFIKGKYVLKSSRKSAREALMAFIAKLNEPVQRNRNLSDIEVAS